MSDFANRELICQVSALAFTRAILPVGPTSSRSTQYLWPSSLHTHDLIKSILIRARQATKPNEMGKAYLEQQKALVKTLLEQGIDETTIEQQSGVSDRTIRRWNLELTRTGRIGKVREA